MNYNSLTTINKTISLLTSNQVMEMAKSENITFNLIAKKLNISNTSAMNIFMENAPKTQIPLPEILCLDEVYLGRKSRRKFAGILMNFESGKFIDLVYGRVVEDCIIAIGSRSREERYNVQYVSTDMYSGFIRSAKVLFPKAKVCVDSFHVVSLIISGYKDLIIEIRRTFENNSKEYFLLKTHADKLLRNENNIDWYQSHFSRKLGYHIHNYRIKELLFDIDPRIEKFYRLKEDYISFNRLKTADEIQFDSIVSRFRSSKIPHLEKTSRTLIRNKEYILNSFTRINGRRISNGPIEARNKTVKLIIRNASGYRNFENFKARVMYVLNNK